MFDDILKQAGIDPSTLNGEEMKVLEGWAEMYKTKSLTLEDIKGFINNSIDVISRELAGVKPPENIVSYLFRKRRETHLKARLYNWILLRDFINTPDKILSSLQRSISAKKAIINKP